MASWSGRRERGPSSRAAVGARYRFDAAHGLVSDRDRSCLRSLVAWEAEEAAKDPELRRICAVSKGGVLKCKTIIVSEVTDCAGVSF